MQNIYLIATVSRLCLFELDSIVTFRSGAHRYTSLVRTLLDSSSLTCTRQGRRVISLWVVEGAQVSERPRRFRPLPQPLGNDCLCNIRARTCKKLTLGTNELTVISATLETGKGCKPVEFLFAVRIQILPHSFYIRRHACLNILLCCM